VDYYDQARTLGAVLRWFAPNLVSAETNNVDDVFVGVL